MSKPAKEARGSLSALKAELLAVDHELLKLQRDQQAMNGKMGPLTESGQMKANAQALQMHRKELGLMQREMSSTGETGASMGSEIAGELIHIAGPAAAVIGAFEIVKHNVEMVTDAVREFIVEGSKMAIEANEVREHAQRMFTGLAGGDEHLGGAMYTQLQQLRKEVPQSEKEINSWAASLAGAGMTDPGKLRDTVKAIASASALMGGGEQGTAAAEKIKTMFARAQETGSFTAKGGLKAFVGTGISEADLQKALGMTEPQLKAAFAQGTISADRGMQAITDILTAKGANALNGTMSEWDVIMANGKESFSKLFEDIDTGGFMSEIKSIGDMFSWDTVEGAALKEIFSEIFGETFKAGTSILHEMRVGFIWLEVYALRIATALVPIRPLLETIGSLTLSVVVGAIKTLALGVEGLGIALKPFLWEAEQASKLLGPKGSAATPAVTTAPAHADGGLVKPANGEMFASVAPGEMILPADVSHAVSSPQLGGGESSISQSNSFNFHGVKGAEDAKELMVDALADVLERAALEAGR